MALRPSEQLTQRASEADQPDAEESNRARRRTLLAAQGHGNDILGPAHEGERLHLEAIQHHAESNPVPRSERSCEVPG
jgi:hypothetical protein